MWGKEMLRQVLPRDNNKKNMYRRDFVKVQQQQQQLDNLDLAVAIDLSHDHGSSLRPAQPARACHIIRISDGADIQAPAERKGVLLLPC